MYDACTVNLLLYGDWGSHLGQAHFSKGPTIFLLLFCGLLMNWARLQAIPSFSWCKWITSVAEQVNFFDIALLRAVLIKPSLIPWLDIKITFLMEEDLWSINNLTFKWLYHMYIKGFVIVFQMDWWQSFF